MRKPIQNNVIADGRLVRNRTDLKAIEAATGAANDTARTGNLDLSDSPWYGFLLNLLGALFPSGFLRRGEAFLALFAFPLKF